MSNKPKMSILGPDGKPQKLKDPKGPVVPFPIQLTNLVNEAINDGIVTADIIDSLEMLKISLALERIEAGKRRDEELRAAHAAKVSAEEAGEDAGDS